MAVLVDNMHVKLYTSSTQVCLHDFRVSLVLTIPLPEVSQPSLVIVYMYKCEGMAVLVDNMHTKVKLYTL